MEWKEIDDEYCISFVFKGDFTVTLATPAGLVIQARPTPSDATNGIPSPSQN